MNHRVIVTGGLSYDYIMDFPGLFSDRIMPDKIHKISLSFIVDKLDIQLGGTAGNIGYTLNLLGITPVILAPAGNNFHEYRNFLEKNKISISSIPIHKDASCGFYFVVTDKEDNQIGSFYTGANRYAKNLKIGKYIEGSDLTIISPTDPMAMKNYVTECNKLHMPYVYDPAFQIGCFNSQELKEGITGAQILIGNDYEIELIQKKLRISHEELRIMVPIVITTLGSKGSIIETSRDSIHVKPAKADNVSDPTGAGDAYRAGFIAGYLRKYDLAVCGQMGSVAAAYTVEKYGTVTHHFTKGEFIKRYKENFNTKIRL